MSWSPAWEPSGLSQTRNSSIFDLSHPRHGSRTDNRINELNKFSINTDHMDRQLPATTVLPPIYGAIGLRRSIPSSIAELPAMIPSVIGGRFPSPPRKNCHPVYPSLARHNLFSPLDTSYACSPAAPGPLVNRAIRPFEQYPLLSPVSPQLPLHLNATGLSTLPKRSKAALAVENWDHPSFARPPHRAFEPQVKEEDDNWRPVPNQIDSNHLHRTPSAMNVTQTITEEPLVPNLYPVPPPPPYEQSAAPLADLAADMVWERCYFPKTRGVFSPVSLAPRSWESTFSWSPPHGYHSMAGHTNQLDQLVNPSSNWAGAANTYGVIGAEAKARRINRQYCSSVSSPHTDNSIGPMYCRKMSTGAKIEVKPAFRRWTRQVLEQTLLSPQVLILALYYIDCVAATDVFGDDNSKLSLLPYKMLLSALVVANKTLDDHSYRNSTFANVSSMTNTEVNAIEVAMLSSLNFNVVPTSDQWTNWLKEVASAGERLGFQDPELSLHLPLSRLIISPHNDQYLGGQSPLHRDGSTVSQGSIFDQVPTPDYAWHPNVESIGLASAVDHKPFTSAMPVDLNRVDFRMHNTPATFPCSSDYGGSSMAVDFVPQHGHYYKRPYQRYS